MIRRGNTPVAVRLTVWLVRLYRAALTPFFGPSCRFEPSCSRYAEEALRLHGALRGCALAIGRICRCHPFSRGGLDPVPAPLAGRTSFDGTVGVVPEARSR